MPERYQTLDTDGLARRADPRAMLLAELEDFVTRHRACGKLTRVRFRGSYCLSLESSGSADHTPRYTAVLSSGQKPRSRCLRSPAQRQEGACG
jgi:hypothetical protein